MHSTSPNKSSSSCQRYSDLARRKHRLYNYTCERPGSASNSSSIVQTRAFHANLPCHLAPAPSPRGHWVGSPSHARGPSEQLTHAATERHSCTHRRHSFGYIWISTVILGLIMLHPSPLQRDFAIDRTSTVAPEAIGWGSDGVDPRPLSRRRTAVYSCLKES